VSLFHFLQKIIFWIITYVGDKVCLFLLGIIGTEVNTLYMSSVCLHALRINMLFCIVTDTCILSYLHSYKRILLVTYNVAAMSFSAVCLTLELFV